MASIQKYTVKGKSYWRIVESRRVNGKPRAIPVLHLGTAESLLEKLTNTESNKDITVKSFEHGAIASILAIAKEVDLVSIINRHVPKSRRGVSTGDALLLIMLNRLLDPCSKNSWADWAKKTSLFRFYPHLELSKLSSQFFWDHMQSISESSLLKIEDELVRAVIDKYNLDLNLLFFDTTNCYSYVEDRNDPEWLFQYGHSKEKQTHRRLFGVELLITKESHIPLYHNTYPGNEHDSKLLPSALQKLCSRLNKAGVNPAGLTLVFDRGFLSEDNFNLVDNSELGFVTALRLGDIPKEMFDIPLQKFRKTKKGLHKDLLFYTEKITLWKKERKVVFYISESARKFQTKVLEDQIARKLKELADWNARIMNQSVDNQPDDVKIQKKIEALLSGPYLSEILEISYDPTLPKNQRLKFSVNHKAKEDIILKFFGKRVLVTNRLDWEPYEVIDAYFYQGNVEQAFRTSKDHNHISLRPQFHWTNQSLRVHVFSCFLALLFGQLLLKKAKEVEPKFNSITSVINVLSEIRLAAILSKRVSSLKNPAVVWKTEKSDADSLKLFNAINKLA
jgi:transposase